MFTDALRHPVNQHPVAALLKMIQENEVTADYLLMLGDLTSRVDKQGLISGHEFLKEIATALHVKNTFVTVGNHDIDIRSTHKYGHPNHIAQHFHPLFPYSDEELKNKFWSHGYVILHPEDGICFVIINSTHSNLSDIEVKRGAISDAMLEAIDNELKLSKAELKIMVCHHHPLLHSEVGWNIDNIMINGEKLIALAEKHKFALFLHGHKHHPRITKSNGSAGLPVPVFAAGSFSAFMKGNLATVTRNQFHEVEFRPDFATKGQIRSWEYGIANGWVKTGFQSSGFPSVTGFGFHGSIPDLATNIVKLVNATGETIVSWLTVEASFPETQFLSPVELVELVGLLKSIASLEVEPEPPNPPRVIGKITC